MNKLSQILLAFIATMLIAPSAFSQDMDRIERARIKEMLNNIKNTIKKNYYDPTYHGIDLDARFQKAEARVDEISSTAQGFAVIAQVLVDFNDSHLFFLPPATTVDVKYGIRMQMVGDYAYITSVKPKSDADKSGLKAGDQILSFEGFRPSRSELWKMTYHYYVLSPRTKLRLKVIHAGEATPVNIEFGAEVKQKKRTISYGDTQDVNDLIREWDNAAAQQRNFVEHVGDTAIWKMVTFSIEPDTLDNIMQTKIRGRRNLILDLRGNGGGYVKSLEMLAGHFFDHDVKIADRKGRPEKKKENEASMLKGRKDFFPGKLIVLVDHRSGSASEIFARLMQIEKRGTVVGDTSAGAVMQSLQYPLTMFSSINTEIYYGVSVTVSDVIMSDGKSIEHVGVTPDEIVLPSADDILNGRDPVLSRAVELLGGKLSPQDAYKMFAKAYAWPDVDF